MNQFITEIKFCPECGSLLRGKPCNCGYKPNVNASNFHMKKIWDHPNPQTFY